MKVIKPLLVLLIVGFLGWLFHWALFAPKADVSQRIYQTIQEQEKRADLSFKKVTFEEIVDGNKYWELAADTAIVNKKGGVTSCQNTTGTFYKKGRAVMRFKSPAALWEMADKEILLDKPLGYDLSYENQAAALAKTVKNNPRSIFNLPREYNKGLGYWFQARNLSWKIADQLLYCTGGIVLKKGEITGYAGSLKGDVDFKKVYLEDRPFFSILPVNTSPVTVEATAFEVDSKNDVVNALGETVITWKEAKIVARTASYQQKTRRLLLSGNVKVNYKDIFAEGDRAEYSVDAQTILLEGNIKANQGKNNLVSEKVLVSLKDQKISLAGRSQVIINEEELKK